MRVDEERAVAGIPGIDLVDVLAVTDIGVDRPARDSELLAEIILVIVFLQHFHGTELVGIEHQFGRRAQGGLARGGG